MDDNVCKIFAGMLQYTLLCVFAWMFMQAVYLYDCFVVVMGKYVECTFSQWCLPLYLVPLGITVMSLGLGWSDYATSEVGFYVKQITFPSVIEFLKK